MIAAASGAVMAEESPAAKSPQAKSARDAGPSRAASAASSAP